MHKGKKKETVPIKAAHTVNSISLALELVTMGIGVSWLAPAIVNHPRLSEGDFVNVLPGWTVPRVELNVVMPNRQLPHRVRLYLDHIVEHFAKMPQ